MTIYSHGYIPYTYYIKWTRTGVWYYGVEYASVTKTANPNNLWTTYFTSSNAVAEYRRLNGEPDIIKVTKTFYNQEEALLWETRFLQKVNARHHTLSLNGHNSDGLTFKNKIVSEKTRKSQSETRKLHKWWTDGTKSWFCQNRPNDKCYEGRGPFNNNGAQIGGFLSRNKKWYTNGITSVFILPTEVPDGFYEGRKIGKINTKATRSNKRWYNDGIKTYFILPEDALSHYSTGRLKRSNINSTTIVDN